MTRSPFAVTILPLFPLAALAWPLAMVTKDPETSIAPTNAERAAQAVPTEAADLKVKSAHPFDSISVTVEGIPGKTWTFEPDDDIVEILIPQGNEVVIDLKATWPSDTPETALLVELIPLSRKSQAVTLWSEIELTEKIIFNLKDPS